MDSCAPPPPAPPRPTPRSPGLHIGAWLGDLPLQPQQVRDGPLCSCSVTGCASGRRWGPPPALGAVPAASLDLSRALGWRLLLHVCGAARPARPASATLKEGALQGPVGSRLSPGQAGAPSHGSGPGAGPRMTHAALCGASCRAGAWGATPREPDRGAFCSLAMGRAV